MNKPLISVLLPCYNAEMYVEEAIVSILNQTYTNFELIVINDCSSDGTRDILLKFQKQDSRIILVENEKNLGLVFTLNKGLNLAKGKYIARMDADDISFPERFEKQVDKLESDEDIVICGGGIISFYQNQNLKPHKRLYPLDTSSIRAEAVFNTPFAHPCVMMRTSTLIQNNLFYDARYKYSEDYHLWQRLIIYGECANIDDYLLNYRVLSTSQTANGIKNQTERFEKISAIQNIGLKRIGCELNEKQVHFHYILSLSDYIREIDFTLYDYKFIREYFQSLESNLADNSYCSASSLRKAFERRYLKLVVFNFKRIKFFDRLKFVLGIRFLRSICGYWS